MTFQNLELGDGYATTPYQTGTTTSVASQNPGLFYANSPMATMSMAYSDPSFASRAGFPPSGSFAPPQLPPPFQLQHQHHHQEVHYVPAARQENSGQLRYRTQLPAERTSERRPVSKNIRSITTTFQTRHAKDQSALDRLSEVIHSKPDTEELVRKIEGVNLQDEGHMTGDNRRCPGAKSIKPTGRLRQRPKQRLICEYEGCNREFRLKSARDTHHRAHIGAKTFLCDFPGCGKGFTQPGNLKTHYRRHTGERPYVCKMRLCGKAFVQKSNLTAHERTHLKVKPFLCEFDTGNGICGKRFTVRGNLGLHQNRFHRNAILELIERIEKYPNLASAPEDDRRLAGNLASIWKNLNKGIKGRGKGVNVARASSSTPPLSSPSSSTPSSPRSSPPCSTLSSPPTTPTSWGSSPPPSFDGHVSLKHETCPAPSNDAYPLPKHGPYHHDVRYQQPCTGVIPQYTMAEPAHGLPMTPHYGMWAVDAGSPASTVGSPDSAMSPACYRDNHDMNYGHWVRFNDGHSTIRSFL